MYTKYKGEGLEILAFPSREFGGQEFENCAEVKSFVRGKYPDCTFPLFQTSKVNGPDMNPVFKFLKGKFPGDTPWNFGSSFLVDRQGNVLVRFGSTDSWADIEKAIQSALKGDKPSKGGLLGGLFGR